MRSLKAVQSTISKKNHSNNRDIHVYFSIIQAYSSIFRTLCNRGKSRALAYLESWNIQKSAMCRTQRIFIIIAYLESWNIQNTDIYRTQCIYRILSDI